ncbi:hypothetical protein [Methylibium sp.]|uniref:hypothetical protein n=1 Tax=Methylibium sp. TaxID=2067992 RepID=UPI003D0DEC7D
MPIEGDSRDPGTWYVAMLTAIVGLQRRDHTPVVEYLRFVEQHRGRAVAEDARAHLKVLAGTRAYADAAEQLAALNTPIAR